METVTVAKLCLATVVCFSQEFEHSQGGATIPLFCGLLAGRPHTVIAIGR
ncbi:hypothetical protein NKI77_25070 [Mesorhizobium opportunistum]|uniref:Uncharacterized protein n=1 Tax=Mesorhizobium opportunistum TaxID=593909 RepID=A0ABV1YLF8_9HYPH|nr:hypothetical protein [Mesorhizobium sp.]